MSGVERGHFLMGSLGLYQVGKFLGRGSYGKVAECTKMGSSETFAIKIIDDLRAGSEEMEAMKIIHSLNPDQNNLIKIHECFQYKDCMCLVYEMLDESLDDFIGKRSFHPTHLCQIRAIAQQMLVALSGLESINVLHGDIKPDNIMFVNQITNPLKLKLIDFGLAVNPQELKIGTMMQINPFRAPEVILGLPLDVSVDMWSLGVVLATLYIGDVPFPYNSDYETIRGLVQLLGLPEDDLLHYGKFTYDFFTYEEESSQPGWRLNMPREYTEATGEVVKGLNEIPDLEAMAEFHHDTLPLYEEDDHRAFLELLRSMLAIDPRQRMTPSLALAHDFITMGHLSGERKASYAASAKRAMREAGIEYVEERFPTTPTDVVSVSETREEERCHQSSNTSMTDNKNTCDAPPAGIKEEPATQPGHNSQPANSCEKAFLYKTEDDFLWDKQPPHEPAARPNGMKKTEAQLQEEAQNSPASFCRILPTDDGSVVQMVSIHLLDEERLPEQSPSSYREQGKQEQSKDQFKTKPKRFRRIRRFFSRIIQVFTQTSKA